MKLYLAGPMRGYPEFNFPAFHEAAAKLRAAGYFVFSPAENDIQKYGEGIQNTMTGDELEAETSVGFSLRKALLDDMTFICKHADGIALLPGWEQSKGATAERALSIALGLKVAEVATYLGE